MNSKIEELWNKAAASSAAYPSGRNNSWQTQVNFMNTFAELVILECSYLADQAHYKATGGKTAGGYIREQFGVVQ